MEVLKGHKRNRRGRETKIILPGNMEKREETRILVEEKRREGRADGMSKGHIHKQTYTHTHTFVHLRILGEACSPQPLARLKCFQLCGGEKEKREYM